MRKTTTLFITLAAAACIQQAYSGIYLGAQFGYSYANYRNADFTTNYSASKIKRGGTGSYRVYLGYSFNEIISSELSVNYFDKPEFTNVSDGTSTLPTTKILNNVISLTLKMGMPIFTKLYIGTELGIGYVARSSIIVNNTTVLPQGNFITAVYGLNLRYAITNNWKVIMSFRQAPANEKHQLPVSNFYGVGFGYWF